MEQRKRRRELVEARWVSSVSVEAVERPVLDWIDPVLKRVVAKRDTWRNAISEHVTLLSSAVGTNRKSGGKGKALVRWMTDQANVLTELWEKGVLPDESGGEASSVVPRASDVLHGPVGNEVGSIADRAAKSSSSASSSPSSSSSLIHREPPARAVERPNVLPDLW